MTKLGLIHGAFVVETNGEYYQVGDVKGPGDYTSFGFVKPVDFDPVNTPYIKLELCGEAKIAEPYITFDDEGEEVCQKIFDRLVIKRNGSTSTRMWYLFFDAEEYSGQKIIHLQWLLDIPEEIWEIVQDEVWSC